MKAKQYTIRNIPAPVDRYYRKLAKISGKSLNQVIIDELSERSGVHKQGESLAERLSWFIGSGMDEDVIKFLEEDDKIQKELTRKQWLEDDN